MFRSTAAGRWLVSRASSSCSACARTRRISPTSRLACSPVADHAGSGHHVPDCGRNHGCPVLDSVRAGQDCLAAYLDGAGPFGVDELAAVVTDHLAAVVADHLAAVVTDHART